MSAKKKVPAKESAAETAVGKLAGQAYKVVAIDTLREHPKNPRKGDVELIEASIAKNDFYGAVIVQKSTGRILAGNHRWKAAKASGMKKIPAIFVDVDDTAALRILLADNRTSDEADYLDAVLLDVLQEVNVSGGLDGTGYEPADLAKLLAAANPPEHVESAAVPEHDAQTKMVHRCPRCEYEWAAGNEKPAKRSTIAPGVK